MSSVFKFGLKNYTGICHHADVLCKNIISPSRYLKNSSCIQNKDISVQSQSCRTFSVLENTNHYRNVQNYSNSDRQQFMLINNFHSSVFLYTLNTESPNKEEKSNEEKSTTENTWFCKRKKENIWTIPNMLTLLRIFATPALGYLVVNGNFGFATTVFVCAGITDVLDGYIARNFANQSSSVGSYLDPLADKFLVSVLTITLTVVDLIPTPLALLIIGRDVGLIAAAFYVRYISLPPPITVPRFFDPTCATVSLQPSTLSKANTAIQLSLVALTLAAPVFGYVNHPLLQGLWFITATSTIASGLGYMLFDKHFYNLLKKRRMKDKS